MKPDLHVVATTERPANRAKRLMAEAKSAARDHVEGLHRSLIEVMQITDEIAAGGDAYPAGARDLCRRLNEQIGFGAQTLQQIMRSVQS